MTAKEVPGQNGVSGPFQRVLADIRNSDGSSIGPQDPFPTDGDSVYVKDLDIPNCDNGDFSGVITDYFDSLKTVNSNTTSDNPKIIKLWFKRTIYSHGIGFGCDNLAKGFGASITIKLLGSGEAVRYTKSFAPSDPNSFLAEFGQKAFNGVILEFNTASEVGLSNLTIAKSTETNSSLQGQDPNGDTQNVQVTTDGFLSISDNSSGLAIAQGLVSGASNVSKFGQNADIGTGAYEDIWDVGGTYPYPTNGTAPITYIDSDSGDTEPVEVQGLDINGELTIQTKTLTGTTPVELDTPLWRVFRMKNMGTSDFVGNIQAINTADTVIYAQVQDGNNQTLMALYTIPLGKTGYLQQGTNSLIGSNRDYTISGRMMMRPYGGVFQLKRTFGLQSDGTSFMIMPFPVPGKVPALTDIKVSAISSSAGGGLNTTFELVLVDD